MKASHQEVQLRLREGGGVLRRRDHPQLTAAIDWQVRLDRLRAVLPGVYIDPVADDLALRMRAVCAWDADAVVTERAAARASFWPDLPVARVKVAVRSRKAHAPGFVLTRRRVPPELICEIAGVRCTSAALTALDLSTTMGGNVIDTVLRTRAATLDQLHTALALTPCRRGNVDRRVLLLDSRGTPWSEAERALHRLLREAGIEGWEGNHGVEMLSGSYWIDVAFPGVKLAIEVDGWQFHHTREAFESDRWRQNDLVLKGWRVLRFTAAMLRDQPQIVLRLIERALAG